MDTVLSRLIVETKEKIHELEEKAHKIFLKEGDSELWKSTVEKIVPLKMMLDGYLDLDSDYSPATLNKPLNQWKML